MSTAATMTVRVPKTVGARVRLARHILGLKQYEVAKAAEINLSTLCTIERDRVPPTEDHLRRLAPVLKTTIAALRGE